MVENRFSNVHHLEWRDLTLLLQVRVPSSGKRHIMELQLTLRRLAEIKEEAHPFYEAIRAVIPNEVVAMILDILVTDTTLDLGITKSEWLQCLPNKNVRRLLDELGIPPSFRADLFDIVDVDGSGTMMSSELQDILMIVKRPFQAQELAGCH